MLGQIAARDGADVRAVVGKVTAVTAPTVTVSVHGTTYTGVSRAKTYASPAVNHVVLILLLGDSMLVLTNL